MIRGLSARIAERADGKAERWGQRLPSYTHLLILALMKSGMSVSQMIPTGGSEIT
jgi:PHP family Zn ribbon phosphoesterase